MQAHGNLCGVQTTLALLLLGGATVATRVELVPIRADNLRQRLVHEDEAREQSHVVLVEERAILAHGRDQVEGPRQTVERFVHKGVHQLKAILWAGMKID